MGVWSNIYHNDDIFKKYSLDFKNIEISNDVIWISILIIIYIENGPILNIA